MTAIGTATYIRMSVTAPDGQEFNVWQKSVVASVTITTAMTTTYVDASGAEIILEHPYEMTVVDGEVLDAPGGGA